MNLFVAPEDITDSTGLTQDQGVKSFVESENTSESLDTASNNVINKVETGKKQEVTPRLKRYIDSEPEGASAISEDVDKLSNAERMLGKIFTSGTRAEKSANIGSGSYDLMMHDMGFNYLSGISNDMDKKNKEDFVKNESRELGYYSIYDKPDDKYWVSVPGGIATAINGMADSIIDNPKTAAAGAIAGFPLGGIVGSLTGALMTAGAKQTFKTTAGQIWNDNYLSLPDEVKQKVDKDRLQAISIGAATVSAGIEVGSTFLLGGSVSKAAESTALKQLSVKGVGKLIQESTAKGVSNATLDALYNLGKVTLSELARQGLTAGAQDVVSQTANKAAAPEGYERDFSTNQLMENILVGTGTGLLFRGAGALLPKKKLSDANTPSQPPRDVSPDGPPLLPPGPSDGGPSNIVDVEVLNETPTTGTGQPRPAPAPKTLEMFFFERALNEKITAAEEQKQQIAHIAEDLKTAKSFDTPAIEGALSNITPEDAHFYIDSDAIAKLESERQGFREAFERNTGVALTEDQGIYTLSAKELFKLNSQDKRVLDYITLTPDGNSLDTLKLLNDKWKNNEVVNTVFDGLDIENITDENRKEISNKIHKIMLETLDGVHNKETFILRTVVDDYIKNTIPLDVTADIEKAIFQERAKIADEIIAKEKKRVDKLIFSDVREQLEPIEQQITSEIARDSRFSVEQVYRPQSLLNADLQQVLRNTDPNFQSVSEEVLTINTRSKHKSKKAFSPLAIDPDTLPEDLKDVPKNPRVKAKKVFVKGGLDYFQSGDDIAKALGFTGNNPGRQFIKSLLTQETEKEYYERRYNEEISKEIETASIYFGSMQEDFEKAYQRNQHRINEIVNVAQNHTKTFINFIRLQGRKFDKMKKNEMGEVLYNEISIAATYYSYSLPVKNLDPRIYEVNTTKFDKLASDSLAKGRWAEFFRYKYAETLNDFIRGNSVKLRKAIQDRIRYIKKLNTKQGQEILYKAGPDYADAYNAIINSISGDTLRYDDLTKVIDIINQYKEHGVVVPKEVLNLVNRAVKVQVGDMTVSEALGLLDIAISIHSAASNDIIIKRDKEILTTINMEKLIEADLSNRPESDPKRFIELTEQLQSRDSKSIAKSIADNGKDALTVMSVQIQNAYTIVRLLDYGKEKGFYSNLITDRITEAHALRGQYNDTFFTWEKNAAEKTIGIKEYNKIQNDVFTLSELKNDLRFPNKRVSRFDLVYMLMLFGSDTGRPRLLTDLKFKEDEMIDVFQKYLEPSHVQFAAEIHKYFRTVDFERYVERNKELGLPPPKQVIPKPYHLHGQEWMGGYAPIMTELDLAEAMLAKQSQTVDALVNGTFTRSNVININTKDGSELERQKRAISPLKYDRNSFISMIKSKNHNAAFAQPMLDMSKVFGNRNIQKQMINFLGVAKFANLLGTIQNVSNGRSDYDTTFQQHLSFKTNGLAVQAYKNMYTSSLSFGLGTAVRQFLAVPTMVNALIQQYRGDLGPAIAEYFTESMKQSFNSLLSPKEFRDTIKAIGTVSPQFKSNLDALAKYPGWQTLLNLEEVLDVTPNGRNKLSDGWFNAMAAGMTHILFVQLMINTVLWKISYKSALEGKIIGINAGDEQAALIFADKMVNKTGSDETGLDKSPLQRTMVGQLFFAFRNQINLQNNEMIGGFQMLGTEFKNQQQVTSKGISGALITILSNSIVPAAIGVVTFSASKALMEKINPPDVVSKYEEKPLMQIALSAGDSNPWVAAVMNAVESTVVYGQRPENIQFSNPALQAVNASLQTIVTAFNSIYKDPGEVVWTKQRAAIGIKLLTDYVFGLPNINVVPNPFDPNGKNLKSKAIEMITDDLLKLPSRREFLSKPKYPNGASVGGDWTPEFPNVENIDPNVVVAQATNPQPMTKADEIQTLFNDIIEQLKNPELTAERRSYLEQARDVLYSVKGYTNPEGNQIETTMGTVKFDDYGREFFTVTIDAIARLESGARTGLTSKSGAKGYFQFLDSTWQGLSELYPNYNLPANANLAPKELQYQIYWKFLGENLLRLKNMKQEWSSENIFLIHMMGPKDFKTFVDADPDTDLTDLLPVQFEYNPSIMGGKTKRNILTNLESVLNKHKLDAETFLKSEKLLTSKP